MIDLDARPDSADRASKLLRNALLVGVSALATVSFASPVSAQDSPAAQDAATTAAGTDDDEAIVITGIRASVNETIAIKRDSSGVVDAISAEDIGKFPDTNLAESLQRVTGVSITRSNGEGSQVTVRGFGPQFNLVTVNGRQLPATLIDLSTGNAFATGTSRSFDFQNLASEGVARLEVYKTAVRTSRREASARRSTSSPAARSTLARTAFRARSAPKRSMISRSRMPSPT